MQLYNFSSAVIAIMMNMMAMIIVMLNADAVSTHKTDLSDFQFQLGLNLIFVAYNVEASGGAQLLIHFISLNAAAVAFQYSKILQFPCDLPNGCHLNYRR